MNLREYEMKPPGSGAAARTHIDPCIDQLGFSKYMSPYYISDCKEND
jgi:hypothetical protein